MLHIFVSLRCEGKTYDEMRLRQKAIFKAYKEKSNKYKDDLDLVDSLSRNYVPGESNRIEFLGISITKMCDADVVLVPLDYRKSKGCTLEALTAKIYGLSIVTYLIGDSDNNVYFLDGLVETF